MKVLFRYLFSLSAGLLLATCSDKPEIPPTLTVSGTPQSTLSSAPNTVTLSVTTTAAWTASSNQSWCRPDIKSGSGNGTVIVTVDENQTYDGRTAEITFSNAEHGLKSSVTLSQAQKDAILPAKNSYKLKAEATDLNFEVSTNVDFQVSIDVAWITRTEARALQEVPVSFHIDQNPTFEPREGTISLTHGAIKQEIKILQEGREQTSYVVITHTNQEYSVPILTGDGLSGVIQWGDDTSEEYRTTASHLYTGEAPHTVTIESLGAAYIRFDHVKGITRINLSEF